MTCTEERFLKDVADHTLGVVYEDGINRHIRFRANDTSNCWFEIVTWPERLCINGDHGCYVFSRIYDMFEFFRHNGANAPDKPLYINNGYWAEKLQAAACDGRGEGKVRGWSPDKFEQRVKKAFVEHIRENMRGMRAERRDLRLEIEYNILEDSQEELSARAAACAFDQHGLTFEDAYNWNCTEWNFHFIWCLYAIVWGIQQYDKAKPAQKEAA
jgi:hypothetical protein